MSAQHTTGRMGIDGDWLVAGDAKTPVAEASYHDEFATRDANLRRLAACWNACEGLTQDHFDGDWTAKGLSQYAKTLEGQVADLRAALAAATALQAQGDAAATQHCGWFYIDDDGNGPFLTESEKYASRYLHAWKVFKVPPSDGHTCDYTLAYGCCSQCETIDAAMLAARREG